MAAKNGPVTVRALSSRVSPACGRVLSPTDRVAALCMSLPSCRSKLTCRLQWTPDVHHPSLMSIKVEKEKELYLAGKNIKKNVHDMEMIESTKGG